MYTSKRRTPSWVCKTIWVSHIHLVSPEGDLLRREQPSDGLATVTVHIGDNLAV